MSKLKFINPDTRLDLLIIFSSIVVLSLSIFLGRYIFKSSSLKSVSPVSQTPVPIILPPEEGSLFYARVDSVSDSQVTITVIDPIPNFKPNSTILKLDKKSPISYTGAVNNLTIPSSAFSKLPQKSSTLHFYGTTSADGLSIIVTKIEQ